MLDRITHHTGPPHLTYYMGVRCAGGATSLRFLTEFFIQSAGLRPQGFNIWQDLFAMRRVRRAERMLIIVGYFTSQKRFGVILITFLELVECSKTNQASDLLLLLHRVQSRQARSAKCSHPEDLSAQKSNYGTDDKSGDSSAPWFRSSNETELSHRWSERALLPLHPS